MSDERISLSDLIADLRSELAEAQEKGKGKLPRLKVEETEIELHVVVSRDEKTGGGIKFWVFNAEIEGKVAAQTAQKIRLKLKPADEDFEMRAKKGNG